MKAVGELKVGDIICAKRKKGGFEYGRVVGIVKMRDNSGDFAVTVEFPQGRLSQRSEANGVYCSSPHEHAVIDVYLEQTAAFDGSNDGGTNG